MPKIDVYNIEGKKVSDIELNENVFGIKPNEKIVHIALVNYMANQRQGTANTKTRAEVAGGGRKPWRQKGTGNARQGSIRAPHWVGGGVVFGPNANRNYTKKMNKKERRLALKSALTYKANDKEIIAIEKFDLESNKTRDFLKFLEDLKVNGKALIVTTELTDNNILATRNVKNVKLVLANELNTYDVLAYDKLIITEDAIKYVEEVLK